MASGSYWSGSYVTTSFLVLPPAAPEGTANSPAPPEEGRRGGGVPGGRRRGGGGGVPGGGGGGVGAAAEAGVGGDLRRGRGGPAAGRAALVRVRVRLVRVVEDELLAPGGLIGAELLVLAGVLGPAGAADAAVRDDAEAAAARATGARRRTTRGAEVNEARVKGMMMRVDEGGVGARARWVYE